MTRTLLLLLCFSAMEDRRFARIIVGKWLLVAVEAAARLANAIRSILLPAAVLDKAMLSLQIGRAKRMKKKEGAVGAKS
jgi:hypothetical protein